MDNHHVHARLVLVRSEAGDHHDDHHCRKPYERVHAGTRCDTRGNGPKQIQQVERILDRRSVTDDRQSTDHTERDDHVGRDRERHHAGEHAHAHKRHGKAARVHHAGKKALVHVVDQDAHGERHEQRQADLGRVDLAKRLQDGVLKKVPGAHGLNIPSVLKIRFPVIKTAQVGGLFVTQAVLGNRRELGRTRRHQIAHQLRAKLGKLDLHH